MSTLSPWRSTGADGRGWRGVASGRRLVSSTTERPMQRDCVLPISRGGRYTLDNVAPACGPCNASKCNDEVTSWMRRKRLDERAFLVRHAELRPSLTA